MNHTPATDVNALPTTKDKAMLAKKAPALARSDTHDVGHAEVDVGAESNRSEIKRMSSKLNQIKPYSTMIFNLGVEL